MSTFKLSMDSVMLVKPDLRLTVDSANLRQLPPGLPFQLASVHHPPFVQALRLVSFQSSHLWASPSVQPPFSCETQNGLEAFKTQKDRAQHTGHHVNHDLNNRPQTSTTSRDKQILRTENGQKKNNNKQETTVRTTPQREDEDEKIRMRQEERRREKKRHLLGISIRATIREEDTKEKKPTKKNDTETMTKRRETGRRRRTREEREEEDDDDDDDEKR